MLKKPWWFLVAFAPPLVECVGENHARRVKPGEHNSAFSINAGADQHSYAPRSARQSPSRVQPERPESSAETRTKFSPFQSDVKMNNKPNSYYYSSSFHLKLPHVQVDAGMDTRNLQDMASCCFGTVLPAAWKGAIWIRDKALKMSLFRFWKKSPAARRQYHVIRGDGTSDVWVAELDGALPTVQLSPGVFADRLTNVKDRQPISADSLDEFGITAPNVVIERPTMWDLLFDKAATVKLGFDGGFPFKEDVSDADVGSFPVYVRNDRGEHTEASPAMTRVVRWLMKFIPTEQIEKRRCFEVDGYSSTLVDHAKQGELETAPKDLKEISETENSAVCVFQREYPLPHFPQIIALQSLVFLRNEKGVEEDGTDVVTLRKNDKSRKSLSQSYQLQGESGQLHRVTIETEASHRAGAEIPTASASSQAQPQAAREIPTAPVPEAPRAEPDDSPPSYEEATKHRKQKLNLKRKLKLKKQKLKVKKQMNAKKQHKTK